MDGHVPRHHVLVVEIPEALSLCEIYETLSHCAKVQAIKVLACVGRNLRRFCIIQEGQSWEFLSAKHLAMLGGKCLKILGLASCDLFINSLLSTMDLRVIIESDLSDSKERVTRYLESFGEVQLKSVSETKDGPTECIFNVSPNFKLQYLRNRIVVDKRLAITPEWLDQVTSEQTLAHIMSRTKPIPGVEEFTPTSPINRAVIPSGNNQFEAKESGSTIMSEEQEKMSHDRRFAEAKSTECPEDSLERSGSGFVESNSDDQESNKALTRNYYRDGQKPVVNTGDCLDLLESFCSCQSGELKDDPSSELEADRAKVFDVIERLRRCGLQFDEIFFEQVRHKMDLSMPEKSKIRITIKILKTKYRKLKRRERRKEVKINNSCSEDEDSDEEFGQCSQNGKSGKQAGFLSDEVPELAQNAIYHPTDVTGTEPDSIEKGVLPLSKEEYQWILQQMISFKPIAKTQLMPGERLLSVIGPDRRDTKWLNQSILPEIHRLWRRRCIWKLQTDSSTTWPKDIQSNYRFNRRTEPLCIPPRSSASCKVYMPWGTTTIHQ